EGKGAGLVLDLQAQPPVGSMGHPVVVLGAKGDAAGTHLTHVVEGSGGEEGPDAFAPPRFGRAPSADSADWCAICGRDDWHHGLETVCDVFAVDSGVIAEGLQSEPGGSFPGFVDHPGTGAKINRYVWKHFRDRAREIDSHLDRALAKVEP